MYEGKTLGATHDSNIYDILPNQVRKDLVAISSSTYILGCRNSTRRLGWMGRRIYGGLSTRTHFNYLFIINMPATPNFFALFRLGPGGCGRGRERGGSSGVVGVVFSAIEN